MLAETAEPQLRGARQLVWLERLEAEHGNLRAALAWALARENVDIGVRLAAALWWFWFFRAYDSEGRRWVEAALARSDAGTPVERRTPARVKALAGAGHLAWGQGDYALARTWYEESLTLSQAGDHQWDRAFALVGLAWVAESQGDYKAAQTLSEESLALFRAEGDPWGQAFTLHCLGWVTGEQGDFEGERTLVAESLALFRTVGISEANPTAETQADVL